MSNHDRESVRTHEPRRVQIRTAAKGHPQGVTGPGNAKNEAEGSPTPNNFYSFGGKSGISVPIYRGIKRKKDLKMAEKPKITEKTLVNSASLALVLDLTARRVQQLAEEGVIEKKEDGYLLVDSVRKYIAAKELPERSEEAAEIERKKNKAEADLKTAKAAVAKLEAEQLRGVMHRAEDVKALTEEMISVFWGAVMSIPGRVAAKCAACEGNAAAISDEIRKEVYTILNELAEYKFDDETRGERIELESKGEETTDNE